MGGQLGVKETKEIVTGVMVLGGTLYAKFKDGVQAQDAVELFALMQGDAEFKKILFDAYTDAQKAGAELKELDIQDGIELGVHILAEGKKLVEKLRS
jgi:hypothetical protein